EGGGNRGDPSGVC
uniref:Tremerogen A-13 n=2 Tax=Tremella mesenterica TaxID=5217 RepID=TA13_TREME|nr:RecName: Full=Tremerogen A-13 [Tremella mesenterica]prf//0705139A tremerogen a13 [Tremella mesenterica]